MKKKLFVFMSFVLTLCCCFFLSACGEEEGGSGNGSEAQPYTISVEYVGDIANFDATSWSYIQYSENINFQSSDFKVTLDHGDGTTKELTSDFTFKVYQQVENAEDGVVEYIEATSFTPGSIYKIVIGYGNVSAEVYFNVTAIDLAENDVECSLQSSYPYNPDPEDGKVKPPFTLTYKDQQLVEGEDYDVGYGSNNTVGKDAGSVYVSFKGLYSGTVTYTFDIEAVQAGKVELKDITTTYDGQDKSGECQIDLASFPIKGVNSIEYEYYDANNDRVWEVRNVGTYKVVAHVITADDYSPVDDIEFTLTVEQLDISNLNLSTYKYGENQYLDAIKVDFKNMEYSTNDFSPIVFEAIPFLNADIKMSQGNNIDNLNVSNTQRHGQFEIIGSGNCKGMIVVPFTIEALDIENAVVGGTTSVVYDGTAKTVSVQYYLSYENINLVENTDFTIVYQNNTNAGEASYTITGIGNYKGTKTGTFEIAKQEIVPGQYYSWNISQADFTYTGKTQDFSSLLVPAKTDLEPDSIFNIEYTAVTYDSEKSSWSNEKNFCDAGSYMLRATFTIKDGNYKLPDKAVYDDNGGVSYESADSYELTSDNAVALKRGVVTYAFTGETSFEYTGSEILPDYSKISITFGDYVLEKGKDYTIIDPENPVNANYYNYYYSQVIITNTNFMFDANYSTTQQISYSINKKVLTADELEITWPTVYKNVWAYDCYLKDDEPGSIKIKGADNGIGTPIDSKFYYTTYIKYPNTGIEGRAIKAEVENDNYIIKSDKTDNATPIDIYKFIGKNKYVDDVLSYTLTNDYFDTFTIDGESLTLQQIEDVLTNGLNYGQKVTITCKGVYRFTYGFQADSAGRFPNGSDLLSALYFTVGSGSYKNDNNETVECGLTSMSSIFMTIVDVDNNNKQVANVNDITIHRLRIASTLDKTYDGSPIETLEYNIYLPNSSYNKVSVSYEKLADNNREALESNMSPTDSGVYYLTINLQNEDDSLVYRYVTRFTISRAEAKEGEGENDYTVPNNLTAKLGQTLADVTLPTGFAWQDDASTSVGGVGSNVFKVTFVSANGNYQKTDIEVTIAVSEQ